MARQRNPRRLVIEALRSMSNSLKWHINRWNVEGTVYVGGRRKRTVLEYPENQSATWLELADWAREMKEAATDLEGYARLQAADTQSRPDLVLARREATPEAMASVGSQK